jgi:dTDP-4-dehydrorhamnose reductase
MRVVVFGRSGQVASELGRAGGRHEVLCLGRDALDLTRPGLEERLPEMLTGAHAAINAAAWTAVDAAETDEAAARVLNADAPGALARACAARGVPFLHVSTDYVFDGSGTRPWTPDDPPGPLGAYGRTKLAGEAAVRAAEGTHAILRTSWVFSAHGGNFVKTMLRLGRERDSLRVVADQIGGPTPAADIAAALLAMAEALGADPARTGTYHYAGTPEVSWAGFAREIFARAGLAASVEDIPTSAYPARAPRPLNSRLDCSGLTAAFGLQRPDWRAGLAAVLEELA